MRGPFARTEAQQATPVYRNGWPFNLQKVSFNPSERLFAIDEDTEASLKSYIKFVSRNGLEEYIGYITASNIADQDQLVDFESDDDVTLTDGVQYEIWYYFVDEAFVRVLFLAF